MHTILHLHSWRMRPSVFCLLDSFDFPILYRFSVLCIFSSLVSLFTCLFLSDLSLSFLCAILTASSFTPVCLFHIGRSHPFCSVSVWRALELCVVCFLSLQPCLIVSSRFHSFIMPVSRFMYFFFAEVLQIRARLKLMGILDEPITCVRTCWGLLFLQQRRSGLGEQDPSPKLVITPMRWAINHLSGAFQFIFSLNSCSYLELKTSISLTVEELRVTANHCDCLLFEEAQMNSWASPAERFWLTVITPCQRADLPPVLTYQEASMCKIHFTLLIFNCVHGCQLTCNPLI